MPRSTLPGISKLCDSQDDARELVGIERKEVEIDVMAVETLDSSLERKLEEAASKGQVVDLCDSDDEYPVYVPAAFEATIARGGVAIGFKWSMDFTACTHSDSVQDQERTNISGCPPQRWNRRWIPWCR
jgi:hypothetical protein